MDLKEEDILGNAIGSHWYYVAKGRALRNFLGNLRADEVLDIGAGSGVFSRQLLENDVCTSAVCLDPNYTEEKIEYYKGKPILFLGQVRDVPQTLLLMMDVLEHVDDDVGLLRQYTDCMPTGGHVLITVPAFWFLWSGHDVFLEHRRRYTRGMLEDIVRQAGLKTIRTRYFFASLFPVVASVRLVKRTLFKPQKDIARSELKIYPEWLNNILITIHDIERHTLFRFNKLAGLSIFCLCKRP